MADGSKVLFTPDGIVNLDDTRSVDRVELRGGQMEWFYQADAFFRHYRLGLHCTKCGADVMGKNADSDRVFSATCKCREFVGPNRDYREPTSH